MKKQVEVMVLVILLSGVNQARAGIMGRILGVYALEKASQLCINAKLWALEKGKSEDIFSFVARRLSMPLSSKEYKKYKKRECDVYEIKPETRYAVFFDSSNEYRGVSSFPLCYKLYETASETLGYPVKKPQNLPQLKKWIKGIREALI